MSSNLRYNKYIIKNQHYFEAIFSTERNFRGILTPYEEMIHYTIIQLKKII